MPETSPMMEQYERVKRAYRDTIVFFRLGDFYEMFRSDAAEASRLLGLTLTKRNGVPMCGIPYHAASAYIGKLVAAGKKVAICEQTGSSVAGKGLVERDVVEVVTPGTVVDENYLDSTKNNYIAALARHNSGINLAWYDLSTGEFALALYDHGDFDSIRATFARLLPAEVIVQDSFLENDTRVQALFSRDRVVNRYPDWSFSVRSGFEFLTRALAVLNLKAFGLTDDAPELFAAGVLLEYVTEAARNATPNVRNLEVYRDSAHLVLDEATQKNLELLQSLSDGSREFSLISVLDHTKTAFGARRLKRWVLSPLRDVSEIERRHERVSELYHDQFTLNAVREILSGILDLERLSSRCTMDRAHGKDVLALKNSLGSSLALETRTGWFEDSIAGDLEARARILSLVERLDAGLAEFPSTVLTEGNLIRRGYNAELDELHRLKQNSHTVLDEYLDQTRRRTGISSLKIKYNKILGRYIEVTNANKHLVPDDFIRRQSLVNGERFTTAELSEIEDKIASASERIVELERVLFLELREAVKTEAAAISTIAHNVAFIDCIQSFAWCATLHGYTRPTLTTGTELVIENGRHPVVEAHLPGGGFVPNSLSLGEARFAMITGPNMAGKSTFLRQTALIALMAQAGSFVPADDARIGVVDRIFCRVGATDNLARGESTFLVEMNETAYILRTAGERSLVIMDEVGRGTSTQDGLAIAWAVTEYLVERVRARTLFATHFHELTAIENPELMNLSMSVVEENGKIVFLKKVVEGPSDNSYGIHVAELAGVPVEVVRRAEDVLSAGIEPTMNIGTIRSSPGRKKPSTDELFSTVDRVELEILNTNVDSTTPLAALSAVARWKSLLETRDRTR